MLSVLGSTLTLGAEHFRLGREYYYFGRHPLTWEDSTYALRWWRLGLHLYVRGGLRIVGNDLDLNDDGQPDIVLLNNEWYFRHDYQPYYVNLGGGRFSSNLWKYKSDTMMAIDGGWIGDINGDGAPDLVVGVMEKRAVSGVVIYYGFPWNEYRRDTLDAGSVETPAVADLNNDGYLDIVAGVWRDDEEGSPDGRECSKVFYGGIDGYSTDRVSGCLWGGGTHVVLVADLNYDGYLDVFVGSTYYDFEPIHPPRIYYGGPDGIDTTRYRVVWTDPPPYDSFGTYGGTVADINGDGWLDIAGCHNDRIFILWGRELSPESETVFPSEACKALQVADLDGNGLLDIVVAQKTGGGDWHNGKIVLLLNYGDNLWVREELLSPGTNGVLLHDFNGDGWVDIVSAEKEHDYSVLFWNLGYGRFLPSAIAILSGTHKATRGLSVQIFGNVYDRSDSVGFLSPPITLDGAKDLYGVEIFGNANNVKIYVRGRGGGITTPWTLLEAGRIRNYPILSNIKELEYRLNISLGEGAGFRIDSVRFHLKPSEDTKRWNVRCIPFGGGVALYSSREAQFKIYSTSGRLVREGKVRGTVDEVELPKGTYFVLMRSEGVQKGCKVVIR